MDIFNIYYIYNTSIIYMDDIHGCVFSGEIKV